MMPYYEYFFVVLLFIGLAALAAHAYGLQSITSTLILGLIGLLMMAIRRENTWPHD